MISNWHLISLYNQVKAVLPAPPKKELGLFLNKAEGEIERESGHSVQNTKTFTLKGRGEMEQ